MCGSRNRSLVFVVVAKGEVPRDRRSRAFTKSLDSAQTRLGLGCQGIEISA
jgi:hypothetical protein